MTTSEATCHEECPYYTSSKTEVQNANRPEVQLHKMDKKLRHRFLNNVLNNAVCLVNKGQS